MVLLSLSRDGQQLSSIEEMKKGIQQEIQNKSRQSKFNMVQKDNSVKYINQLRPINITKSKYIYFYKNADSKYLFKIIETSIKTH